MAATLGTLNPLTYRGYVYDHETGLYYLQSRYYNPIFRQFISADAYLSTGQGFMGYNMFAYCGNNPVRFKDTTGTKHEISEKDLLGGCAAAWVISIPALVIYAEKAITAASAMVAEGISTVAAEVSVAIEKAAEKATERNHSVYVLKDGSKTVQYVGRTKHVDKRKAAHENNPNRAGLEFEVVASGLTYLEARALEQAGMVYHHTINTANKMNNQINGIAPKCWSVFKEIALGTLNYSENKMTNEILYWTGN